MFGYGSLTDSSRGTILCLLSPESRHPTDVADRLGVIQTPTTELSIMRYELSDNEWSVIRTMLPNKPRGIPRVDDRRTALSAGGGLASGTRSWMRWRWLTMPRCR